MVLSELVEARIESLSHEGRGFVRINGKATFIEGALPSERVMFHYTRRHSRFDEGIAVKLLESAPDRVEPRCRHFGICGGCSLQHLRAESQLQHKQSVLLQQLHHMGGVQPISLLAPVAGPQWGYRRKARLSVRYVDKKGSCLVGFKEKRRRLVAELACCEVLHPRVGPKLSELRALISSLSLCRQIPQIEVAVGEQDIALVIRHLMPLSEADEERLKDFAERHNVNFYLQAAGLETVTPIWPKDPPPLYYRLPEQNIEIHFKPTDFIQVNAEINQMLVNQVLQLLDPQPDERILDLFCGLGNFTLVLARQAKQVIGVDGEQGLIDRAKANAKRNGIDNVFFYVANLAWESREAVFLEEPFDKVLIDPPRTGAIEIIRRLSFEGVKRIVYVSCNPATLARDSRILVYDKGYRLLKAGIFDMFPHTAHVESICLFERRGRC